MADNYFVLFFFQFFIVSATFLVINGIPHNTGRYNSNNVVLTQYSVNHDNIYSPHNNFDSRGQIRNLANYKSIANFHRPATNRASPNYSTRHYDASDASNSDHYSSNPSHYGSPANFGSGLYTLARGYNGQFDMNSNYVNNDSHYSSFNQNGGQYNKQHIWNNQDEYVSVNT